MSAVVEGDGNTPWVAYVFLEIQDEYPRQEHTSLCPEELSRH